MWNRKLSIRKQDKDQHNDEEEILPAMPHDVDILSTLSSKKQNYRIQIAKRLFGPPRLSLIWSKRRLLFQELGRLETMTEFILKGTTMGQVIPGETLALGISKSLIILQMDAGLIFDDISGVCQLARSLQHHQQLQEVRLCNFLNHVMPVDALALLDPLIQALATISTLETLELSCIASFVQWKKSFISTEAMALLFEENKKLRIVNFTNLGLEDEQFKVIAQNAPSTLKELILNANDNTQSGLRKLVDMVLDPSSSNMIIRVEVMNHVKLDADTFEVLHRHLQHHSCRLQAFQCTHSIATENRYRRTIGMHLQLHCLNMDQRYYHPLATPTNCIQVLSEVNGNLECLYALLR